MCPGYSGGRRGQAGLRFGRQGSGLGSCRKWMRAQRLLRCGREYVSGSALRRRSRLLRTLLVHPGPFVKRVHKRLKQREMSCGEVHTSHCRLGARKSEQKRRRGMPPPGNLYDYQKKRVASGGVCMNVKRKELARARQRVPGLGRKRQDDEARGCCAAVKRNS